MVGGAFSPRVSKDNQSLTYVGFDAGSKHLYVYENLPRKSEPAQDPLARARAPETASPYALRHWTDDIQSPYLLGAVRPYRFQASTDLFLPFLYYSTLDGLVAADVWQASDLLGNHQIQQQMQYASGVDFIDFAMFYTYARYRPDFTVGFRRSTYYRDFDEQDQRRETNAVAFARYPLDRVNSVILGGGVTNRVDTYLDDSSFDAELKDRYWLAGYVRDTVTGRYLVATRGSRLSITYQDSIDAGAGNQNYKTGNVEGVTYIPLARESTFVTRLFYGRSTGDTPQVFRLGGIDRIRGVSSGSLDNKKSNVVLSSAEARLRLKYLNARTKFLFPDFFFKAAYLILFDDIGYGWDNRTERQQFDLSTTENSAGVGISWPTFILQSFQLNLTVQWAKRTDDGRQIWFITVGPQF
jgi:outer membrane protein assembly factor BamA